MRSKFLLITFLYSSFLLIFLQSQNVLSYEATVTDYNSASTYENTKFLRIVGGVKTAQGFAPWFAGLLDSTVVDNWNAQFCGGALIHPEWVVTAAHCVFDSADNLFKAKALNVLVGTHSLFEGGERIAVNQIIVHPRFDNKSLKNDIALLHLVKSMGGQSFISLPGKSFDIPVVADNAKSTVIGWGSTSISSKNPQFPSELEQVDLPIISESECQSLMGNDIFSTSLCAGFLDGGKDSCQGDSGGPLITSLSGENQLIGIVSWGAGCAQPFSPGVYTRVSKYEEFITRHLCANTQLPIPQITASERQNSDGSVSVTISFSKVEGADKYRLYYAPYRNNGQNITDIRHIDTLLEARTYRLPSNARFYIAGQAVKNNCVSGFSGVAAVPSL